MTRVVLSIGSNLGDRLARLQSVLDRLGDAVQAVSPVYETAAWGGVEQGPFLNAVLIAEDPALDGHGWLRRAQEMESAADRVRGQRWGPRTLDVDLVSCYLTSLDGDSEVFSLDDGLTLPHPLAHLRAFVLIPWLAVDPDAALTVAGGKQSVAKLLAELDAADRSGVRRTDVVLEPRAPVELMGPTRKRDLTGRGARHGGGRIPAGRAALPVVSADHDVDRVCRCWRSASPRPGGGATCGPRSATVRSATGPAGCIRSSVARSLVVAKASAWVGALALGWWVGVLVYLLPRRSWLRVAGEDTAGAAVAAVSALALVIAALWLQHCCKSPGEPTDQRGARSPAE